MVSSLLFVLVLSASTVMADEITDDNCNVTWKNPIWTTNNGTLSMKWEFFKLRVVTEVQFRRHNKTTSETMAILTPDNTSFTLDDKRIQLNFFKAVLSQNLNAVEIISNMTQRETEYDYDILVKLESGCEIQGQPINGSDIRALLPQHITAVGNITADHSEVIGQLGSSISMEWTYDSDQHPEYIWFKKFILSSEDYISIGKLKDGEIENSYKTKVLRHLKTSKGGGVKGLVTLTLLNTTQQDYGASYGLEMFNVSVVESPYIVAKLYVINRSAIVSSQTWDIKLIIIMCSMLTLSLGWKS